MKPPILRPNTSPLYGFLSLMAASLTEGEQLAGREILECGAGGSVPPLALFAQHGMMTYGIDVSEEQLKPAYRFVKRNALSIHLQRGDMRSIPFPTERFDYVYEHFALCHLSHADTARTVQEMLRVLKPGGLAFLGVISTDSWPLSMFGEEQARGEFRSVEDEQDRYHSVFTDDEAARLVGSWELLSRKKVIDYVGGRDLTEANWVALHAQAPEPCSLADWMLRYPSRHSLCRYAHLYYTLRKPR